MDPSHAVSQHDARGETPRPNPPVPDRPMIDSSDAAAQALQDYFLANADRGDNAANDELIDALVNRIRAQRAASDGSP